jgi:hypothetical protein
MTDYTTLPGRPHIKNLGCGGPATGEPEARFIVKFWGGDVRECFTDGRHLRHVLHTDMAWLSSDERIQEIKRI